MPVPDVSVVVVSYNTRGYLERCLGAVAGRGYEVVVVDNASEDASARMVRDRFPEVRLVELPRNAGFGAAANEGLGRVASRFALLMNADAWPRDDGAIPALVACAARDDRAGIVAPRLAGLDGAPQPSLVGLPSRWWTGTPAVSSTRQGRLAAALARPRGRRGAFAVGAALLLRRDALDEVGGFDPSFFMFGEEVDLCSRMLRSGWRVSLCREAEFVHVGGAATAATPTQMYREQVRGHLRLLAKHAGPRRAERARRYLRRALRTRSLLASGQRREMYRETASWLASADAETLLAAPDRPGRSEPRAGRTSRGAG
jgi:GT2 family glycosyltransferase